MDSFRLAFKHAFLVFFVIAFVTLKYLININLILIIYYFRTSQSTSSQLDFTSCFIWLIGLMWIMKENKRGICLYLCFLFIKLASSLVMFNGYYMVIIYILLTISTVVYLVVLNIKITLDRLSKVKWSHQLY